MPNRSKEKGNRAERELVTLIAQQPGWAAVRARGSDGRSIGEAESVDVVADRSHRILKGEKVIGVAGVTRHTIQVKRRRALPQWLSVPEGCDMVALREDRGAWYILMPLERYLE